MSGSSSSRFGNAVRRAVIAAGALGLLGALGAACLRHLPRDGAGSRGSLPEQVSARPRESAARPRAASGARVTARSSARRSGAPLSGAARAARERVESWLEKARDYRGDDRAAVLDAALDQVVAAGAKSVSELEEQLAETSVYDRRKRAAAFHALGRIGKDLAGSSDPEAQKALQAIQRLARAELELPPLIEPDPELDVDSLARGVREALLHAGELVEEDGVLYQPTTENKLPVIRMLRTIGGERSIEALQELAKRGGNQVGVELAAEQAIALGRR